MTGGGAHTRADAGCVQAREAKALELLPQSLIKANSGVLAGTV